MTLERARVGEGIELAYEAHGDPDGPPVLLIMGLATQLIGWPDPFVAELTRRGLRAVRFDNRDVGESTHLHDAPRVNLEAVFGGDLGSLAYTLDDMAADARGLLDALGWERAHVVGASMGGMIAQLLALDHPDRVQSLTLLFTTTGDRAVGTASEAAVGVLTAPAAASREAAMDRAVAGARVIGSPGFAFDEAGVRDRAGRSYDRGHDPAGVARQLAAVLAATDRTPRLRSLTVPTLVVHGRDDPLVAPSGGEAIAAAVPGAELWLVDGMGHDLPAALHDPLARRIAEHVRRAGRSRRGARAACRPW